MRFLADESVDIAVVHALRLAEHDVLAIAEEHPGASDEDVTNLASADKRILLTEDRDFGRLVYARLQDVAGVVYMRYPGRVRSEFAQDVVALVETRGERLTGAFVVLQPGRTRISRLPDR